MKYANDIRPLPARCEVQDWRDAMTDALRRKLKLAIELHSGDLDAAIEYVKDKTAAGPYCWAIVLAEHGKAVQS